jgi:hypothetical protein
MRVFARAVLALFVLAMAALMAFPALAQEVTPNSACGAPATGYEYRSHQGTITKTAVTGTFKKKYVKANGDWSICPRGVKDGEFPHVVLRPKDCAPLWVRPWAGAGGYVCTPGQGSRLPPAFLDHEPITIYAASPANVDRSKPMRAGKVVYACQRRADGSAGWVPIETTCKAR